MHFCYPKTQIKLDIANNNMGICKMSHKIIKSASISHLFPFSLFLTFLYWLWQRSWISSFQFAFSPQFLFYWSERFQWFNRIIKVVEFLNLIFVSQVHNRLKAEQIGKWLSVRSKLRRYQIMKIRMSQNLKRPQPFLYVKHKNFLY